MTDKYKELAEAWKEYALFLSKEIDKNAGFLHIHGFITPSEIVEKGTKLRERIRELEAFKEE